MAAPHLNCFLYDPKQDLENDDFYLIRPFLLIETFVFVECQCHEVDHGDEQLDDQTPFW